MKQLLSLCILCATTFAYGEFKPSLPQTTVETKLEIDDYHYIWQLIKDKQYDIALHELNFKSIVRTENCIHVWLMRMYIAEKTKNNDLKKECLKIISRVVQKDYMSVIDEDDMEYWHEGL